MRGYATKLSLRPRIAYKHNAERGVAVLIVSLILLSIAVVLLPTIAILAQTIQNLIQNQAKTVVAYYAAEGAVEDGIYRVKKGLNYSATSTFSGVDGVTATTTIITSGSRKIITVESQSQARYRKVEAVLAINGTAGDFRYGVQVGRGGFSLSNSSKVVGSVYTEGNIVGTNKGEITGDAFVASSSYISGMKIGGQAKAYSITNSQIGGNTTAANLLDNTTVGGNAYASNITSSNIAGSATYLTIDQYTTVGGQRIATTTAPTPLPVIPFPISEAQLDAWESEAEAGGVITSPCPYVITNGQQVSLGPKKINCNLSLSNNNSTLTLTGPIWVKGNISVSNSAVIKLAGYFGQNGSVIIADDPADRLNKGKISVDNSSQLTGSGTDGSYLMAVSRNNSAQSGGGVTAISIGNSSASCVYYSSGGSISMANSVSLREATAYKVSMVNSCTVTYEAGLANLLFTSGPTAGWTLSDWQEKI